MQKNYSYIKTKTATLDISDIDVKQRKVVGYFSAFNNIDSDSDMIVKGAFNNSILEKSPKNESGRKIAHLWNHDFNYPIGKLLELSEDDYGLRFVSQLGRSTKANDVLLNYEDGIVEEHSIGFYYKTTGTEFVKDKTLGDYYRITDLELLEGSTVVLASNDMAGLVSVGKGIHVADMLHEEMNKYIEIIRNGMGSDERFETLEMGLKLLASKYYDLVGSQVKNKEEKLVETTPITEEVEIITSEETRINKLKNLLINLNK